MPEGAIQSGVRGRIPDGVLVADVPRHLVRDAVHFGDVLRKECLAASGLGEGLQGALGPLGFAALFFTEQTHRINQDRALLRGLYQVFQAHEAGVVVAIGNYYQHPLVLVRLLFDVVDGHPDGVPHGGAAARIDARERLFQFLEVAGEVFAVRQIEKGFVIEIDDEGLVFGIGILGQRQTGGFHFGALVPHAAAVVDNQPQRNRDIFAMEARDLLHHPILVNRESLLGKRGHQVAVPIHHRGGADHQTRIRAKYGSAGI